MICFTQSGYGFSKIKDTDPNPDPPTCCGGEQMESFKITGYGDEISDNSSNNN
jgi:hypothetical protein